VHDNAAQAGPRHTGRPAAAHSGGHRGAARLHYAGTTLVKIEKGDAGVAIGSYTAVLFVMGMVERLAGLADSKDDAVGLHLEEERLPQRIRGARKQKRTRRE